MHKSYTAADIQSLAGEAIQMPEPAHSIEWLLTDSRKVVRPERSLFFTLPGKQDSHLFIADLYQQGVRNFVIERNDFPVADFPEANFIQVQNAVSALQKIAAFHRKQFTYPVIAITGSNGKTIVKDWLYQLLSPEQVIVRSPKSYNSQIGVPLSVWQMDETATLGIFEAGISREGEMLQLENVLKPDIGILTNIKSAHDDGFSDREAKLKEKMILLRECKQVILSPDYVPASMIPAHAFTWSFSQPASLQILSREVHGNYTVLNGYHNLLETAVKVQFTDEASLENCVICWAALLAMGYRQEVITERMAMLHPVAMRLELKQGVNNCSIINDSYSADISSLYIAVDFLNQQHQNNKKTIILSDIQHTEGEEVYPLLAAYFQKNKINRVIGIGPEIASYAWAFVMEKQFFNTTEEFLDAYPKLNLANESILIKGARKFEFERIVQLLEQKVHETVLEINLNAIVHNLNFYRSKIDPRTKVMAMVKAFSYGSGSFEIANILQYNKVDYLAVAYADEGIALRKAGISLPIMVMSPEPSAFRALVKYQLEPELYSLRILRSFREYLELNGHKRYPVHLKTDTGMHRLGFAEEDLTELRELLAGQDALHVQSVFSHLAASDEAEHDPYTRQQLELFDRMSAEIRQQLGYDFLKHISNTAAILRLPEAQYDMVRLGIGMYGVDSSGTMNEQLQLAGTLKTTVSQVKHLKKGDTVGYSRKGLLTRDSTIATVKIGYADGYSRAFGNGVGYMLLKGQKCRVIGSICMDMCMLDVTGLDIREGDEAIVFADRPDITEIAKLINTIPYELLTTISQRVKRVYYYE